jgi:hypothetical protein
MAADLGLTVEDMRARLEDRDLFVLPIEACHGLRGEEAVKQWTEAAAWMRALADAFGGTLLVNDATTQVLRDAALRAELMAERAKARPKG